MEETNSSDNGANPKHQIVYRCKKCRRIVAAQENVVPHERGPGEEGFGRKNKKNREVEKRPTDCTCIYVDPLKWMETMVQEGQVGNKLLCVGCKARLGYFNWAGMQCSCGTWINPAFQLVKSRIDECHI